MIAWPKGNVDRSADRRRLLLHVILQEVRKQHAGTALGMSWAVIQPLLLLAAYFFLFTVLRVEKHAPHGSLGEVGVILSGIVPWLFFIHCFSQAVTSLSNHAQLVKQINFPIEVLPFATVGVFVIDFTLGMMLLLALTIWQGWVGWSALMLIPTMLLFTAFLVAMTALLAPLGAMLRDLRNFLPVILRLGLWISPILYLPGTIPQRFHWVMYVNPLTYFLGLIRFSAFGQSFGTRTVSLLSPMQNLGVAIGGTLVLGIAAYVSWGYVRRVAVDYL